MTKTHNTQSLQDFLSQQAAPQPKIVQGYQAVESAISRAQIAAKTVRYGYFLRQLPDFVLDGVVNAIDGDVPATLVLAYMTTRVGALIHKNRNPVLVAGQGAAQISVAEAAENAVVLKVGPRVLMDCAREKLRRGGLIEFDPSEDPFASRTPKTLKLTVKGEMENGEVGRILQIILSDVLLDDVELAG